MKIAMITPGTINSSLAYRPLSLAKALQKRGHEVYVLAPRFDKYSNFKDEHITEIDGVKILRPVQIPGISFELGLLPYIISSTIALYRVHPDIIHIYKPNPITIPGLLLKFLKKTPIVLDADDLDTEVMKIEQNNPVKIKLVALSEKIAASQAKAITSASQYLQKHYRQRYTKKSVVHIPNGADFPQRKPAKKASKNIVFIGNINRINILEPLFYAVQTLQKRHIQATVTIIGDGKYLGYFKKLSKKLGLVKKINFVGYIAQSELHKYIKRGNIGYAYMPNEPTIQACSSMKVFQYMQYDVIPLVSNVGDFPLYTYQGKAGYIATANDQQSLEKTLSTALTNKNETKIAYARNYATKDYQWTNLAKKVETLYKKLI